MFKGKKIFLACCLLLMMLAILPQNALAWSDPGLGVNPETSVYISGGFSPSTLLYSGVWKVTVNGSQVGQAVLLYNKSDYGGRAFIPQGAFSEAVSKFGGVTNHVSSYAPLYTLSPGGSRYYIRDLAYHSGAYIDWAFGVCMVTPSPLPSGSISAPNTAKVNQPVNITIAGASLTNNKIDVSKYYDKFLLNYTFKINGSVKDSGGGSKNINKTISHTFTSPGTYTLTLELTDAFKRKAPPITKTIVVESAGPGPIPVPPPGGKPLADFDMPSMTKPNTSVTVTDRSQAYGGATIVSRTWTITPSGYTGTPAGTSYSVSFPSEGTYTVKLVVKDSKGNTSDPCEKTILVQGDFVPPDPPEPPNGPPVAKMKYPKTVGIGKPAQIQNLSYDTDGTIVDVDWDIDPQEGQSSSSIDDSGLEDEGGTVIFKEEGEYKITLTVEDDGGETASVSGTIDVKNSAPRALISCPTDVMQGDDVVIKNRSYDPDGEIKEVKWTLEIPDGGVIKKSSDNSVVTQFTEDENRVYFDKEGTYKVTIEVTDDWGKKDSTTETIVVKPAIPNAYFEPVGPYKQNRKIVFTAGGTSPSRYPIITSQNEWVIEPVTPGLTADDIKVKLENPDNKGERVLLFKKPGQYRVKLKVTNTAGHTSEWYEKVYDIQPDEPPVADFNVQSAYLRNPENGDIAEILIRDLSYSPDGDVITKRVWKYKFDGDNDGSFDDEPFIVLDDTNNPTPAIRTNHVGKYLVELEVTEGFGEPTGTLDEFISPEDYLKGNTDKKPLQEKKAEVINVQPTVAFDVKKKKKVDIVFTVGDVDASKTSNLKGLITAYLEAQLNSNNVQYGTIQSVDTVEEKLFSGKFSVNLYWDRDGYDMDSHMYFYANGVERGHIWYANKNLYGCSLDYDDTQGGVGEWLTLNFDTLPSDINEIKFYVYPYRGLSTVHIKLFKESETTKECVIDDVQYVDTNKYFGKLVKNGDVWDFVKYDGTVVSGKVVSKTTKSFDEVLKNPLWREDAMHFLVNISDKQYEEFNDPVKAAYIYSKLLKDKVDFSVLGTTANQSQINTIIATNDGNGTFVRNDNPNMEEAIKQISQYIINKVNAAMGGPTNYVLLNEEVEYKTYYNDYENDPEIAQRWMYEHDPNFFENSLGEATFNGQWIGSPVYRFDKVGKYLVDFQKRDNPTPDDRFDEYRLWSFSPADKLSLFVHRRPIGTFTFQMTKR